MPTGCTPTVRQSGWASPRRVATWLYCRRRTVVSHASLYIVQYAIVVARHTKALCVWRASGGPYRGR